MYVLLKLLLHCDFHHSTSIKGWKIAVKKAHNFQIVIKLEVKSIQKQTRIKKTTKTHFNPFLHTRERRTPASQRLFIEAPNLPAYSIHGQQRNIKSEWRAVKTGRLLMWKSSCDSLQPDGFPSFLNHGNSWCFPEGVRAGRASKTYGGKISLMFLVNVEF